MNVPDPDWKTNPDIVADESFRAVYEMDEDYGDDYDEDFDDEIDRENMIYDPFDLAVKYGWIEPFAVYDPD